ncbi:MAG: hypothetical protein QOK43_96 [Acidimicrobiaceae bacterium]|nr:hypothetical protein [Acidimicrobiaceae bacterium]
MDWDHWEDADIVQQCLEMRAAKGAAIEHRLGSRQPRDDTPKHVERHPGLPARCRHMVDAQNDPSVASGLRTPSITNLLP